jgi:hypothetical protein
MFNHLCSNLFRTPTAALLHLLLTANPTSSPITPNSTTPIRHMKHPIHPRNLNNTKNNNLQQIPKAIKRRFRMIPSRLRHRPRSLERRPQLETADRDRQACNNEDDEGFRLHYPCSERFLVFFFAGEEEGGAEEEERGECYEEQENAGCFQTVRAGEFGCWVEGVGCQDARGNNHCQHAAYQHIHNFESVREDFVPANLRLHPPQDPLGEDEVHDVDYENPGVVEDLGREGDADVVGVGGPDDSHDAGCGAGHAEAEDGALEGEVVVVESLVALEEGHVGGGEGEVEGEEGFCDGDVEGLGGDEAYGCGVGGVGRLFGGVSCCYLVWFD